MTYDARPPRPHTALTSDGRRLRQVLSYTHRSGRMSPPRARAWERRADQWWIPDEAFDEPGFEILSRFGREAPLVVEIGSGIGEATAQLAAAHPSYNIVAFDVWRPGIAETFLRLEAVGAHNVRLASVDAAWSLEHVLEPGSIDELWTFFPDPWPKKRHHRRRLVNPRFARLAADRLKSEALWRLATDWVEYAEHMRTVLDQEPRLTGGLVERWPDRPVTRFERRGIRAGHRVLDLAYRRC